MVSTNCSSKQFTNKFLLTSSNQWKVEECSMFLKDIDYRVIILELKVLPISNMPKIDFSR